MKRATTAVRQPSFRAGSDSGASLVFALVAVSILSMIVASLSSAASGGFLAAQHVDATSLSDSPQRSTRLALSGAIEAIRGSTYAGFRSFWSSDARAAVDARCFGVSNSESGANYLDVSEPGGGTIRVYCTPLAVPATVTAANPFVQHDTPPALSDGLVLLHRSTAPALNVAGTGTLLVQGGVRANGAITFTTRTGSCPPATDATMFAKNVTCPQLQVTGLTPDDGTGVVTATACTTAGINAAEGTDCAPTQTAAAPAVPPRAPTTLGTATVANGPLDIACTGSTATLAPGLYSEAATTGITSLLNALTGSTTRSCVVQSTTVRTTANVGATSLSVNNRSGFRAGDILTLGGSSGGTATIKSTYAATTGSGSITLASATTQKWTSGTTVTGAMCVLGTGSPCTGTGGTPITAVQLSPGTFFFDLTSNWTINNSALTVTGGTVNDAGTTTTGNLCVAPVDQNGDPRGLMLAFAGGNTTSAPNASGYGLVVANGTVSLCADEPASNTDRPTVLYGSTAALTGSYRKVGATTNTSYTFKARGNKCATGTTTTCNLLTVTGNGHAYLYGAIYAPYDDVSVVLGPYNDDQLFLHGMVADALTVTTSAVTTADPSRVRPATGLPRKAGVVLDLDLAAFRCTPTCPATPPGTGKVGDAVVSFTPNDTGHPPRTVDIHGPLTSTPYWAVTG